MLKKKNFHIGSLTAFIVFLFFVITPIFFLHAQGTSCDPGKICNPIPNVGTLPELIVKILQFVIKLAIPVIALAVIYAGFLFVTARGNSEKLETAKRALLYTLIGAAILLGSLAIAELISDTVNKL